MSEYPNYFSVKKEFEKLHFKLQNPLCYCQIDIENDDLIIRSKEEFKNLYENLYYTEEEITEKKKTKVIEKETKNFVIAWMKDAKIKTYKCLDFRPCQKVPENVYNLWTGWKASKLKASNLKFENSLIYKHFKYIFGEDLLEYQLDKFAHIIQKGIKTDVCDVLSSDQGTGKDTLYNYIGKNILGEKYYLNEDYIDMLIGNAFNEMISHKVLIVLNESKKAKTDEIINAVKNAITRDKNTIRAKFIKEREETNHINWNVLTNAYDSINIEKGDRRFNAKRINNEHKSDTKYFDALYQEIQSKKYDRACYDFFMQRSIKIKSFQNERPLTEYYKDLQERNTPIIAQFLIHINNVKRN